MKIKDVLHLTDLKEFVQEIYEAEFHYVLNEGWTIHNNTLEVQTFLCLSDEGKTVYAMSYARMYADKVVNWTEEELRRHYGNRFDSYFKQDV